MNEAKIKDILVSYRIRLQHEGISVERFPAHGSTAPQPYVSRSRQNYQVLAHIHWMTFEVEKFLDEERIDKAHRWLGFIQGCLWTEGLFTIDELKSHNRPPA